MQIIYGYQSVKCAINNKNRKKYRLFLSSNKYFKYENQLMISKEKMHQLCKSVDHNGIALEVENFCDFVPLKEMSHKILIINAMEDVGNMGAIIRSAAVFGYDVLLCEQKTSSINARMIKNASGAFEFVKIHVCKNLLNTLMELKKNFYTIIAISEKHSNTQKINHGYKKIALIIGGESQGIDINLTKQVDHFFKIQGKKDFNVLNASVAAAVGMFQFGDTNKL